MAVLQTVRTTYLERNSTGNTRVACEPERLQFAMPAIDRSAVQRIVTVHRYGVFPLYRSASGHIAVDYEHCL